MSLATCYLVAADYERGWPAFEARLGLNGLLPELGIPRWSGEPLAGRTLLLIAEQGVGDTLHFLRYAGVFKGQGARIVLAVQPGLGPLLANHPDVDAGLLLAGHSVVAAGRFPSAPPACALRREAAQTPIPNRVPYLWPDGPRPGRTVAAGIGLGSRLIQNRCIAWQGSAGYSFDHWRSFPLALFAPLAKLPGVRLVSLQKGFGSEQVAEVDFPVLDLSDRLDENTGPFMDTGEAVIRRPRPGGVAEHGDCPPWPEPWACRPRWPCNMRLDCWLREQRGNAWHPTLRLYLARPDGDWPGVFQRIAQDIQTRLAKTASTACPARAPPTALAPMLKPSTLSPADTAAPACTGAPACAAPACTVACPFLAVSTLVSREWVRFIRQRNRVVGAVGQPIIFWLLFGAGLGPSFRMPGAAGDSVSYRVYFFPGSLVLILLFTAIFATISIIEDRREGFLQSVLVAPLPRWSMVLGKVLGGTLLAVAQGLLFLVLGVVAGVRFGPLVGLEIVALVFVIALGLTALGFVIAWRMDSTQGFHAIMSVFLMPMWLLSGAFFPAPAWSTAADWGQRILALVMAVNPLTYGVAALRRLLYEDVPGAIGPDTPSLALCWLVSLGFAALMLVVAWRIAAQRTTGDLL